MWFKVPEYISFFVSTNFKEWKIKQLKKKVNYTINKHAIDRFKIVTDKYYKKNIKYIWKLN